MNSQINSYRTLTLKERDTNSRPTSPYVQNFQHVKSSTNIGDHNKYSRTSQVDLSIIRDRDMIPDIPGASLGGLGSTRNGSQTRAYNSHQNQPKGHVYLPPVSVNEYLIS